MTTPTSIQELRDKTAGGGRIVVADAHWSYAKKPYDSYVTAHIPLAVFCDLELDLAGVPSREAGRNPLPDIERVRDAVRRWGVRSEHLMIVYDAGDGLFASRVRWILRWAGLENACVLTDGLAVWEADGNETASGPGNLPQSGAIAVSEDNMSVANLDDVRTQSERGILVDVCESNHFEGRSERADLQAGHVPSAMNLAVRSLQNADDSSLPTEQLRECFASVGIEDGRNVTVHSGSGFHSSLFIQATVEVGVTGVSLYVGSWSQWVGGPSRPIVRFQATSDGHVSGPGRTAPGDL